MVLPAYLKRDSVWVDLRLDITRGGAHALCPALLRRSASSEHELLGVLAEAAHLAVGARSMAVAKQTLGLIPVLPPVAARSEALAKSAVTPHQQMALELGELTIQAAWSTTPAVVKRKSIAQLQPGDLVVEAARAPGQTEEAVLAAGELITTHRLGALGGLPTTIAQALAVAVVEAPAASRVHLRMS